MHRLPLRRPSANLAALNGGVQPTLEQLRPDMFFGAEDDDDASSVASDAGIEAVRPAAAHSGAGPLGAAMGASRSFSALFSASASGSYSPPVLSLPPLGASSRAGASMQHGASRLGSVEVPEPPQQQVQPAAAAGGAHVPSKAGGGTAGKAIALEAAAGGAAASAAAPALVDLLSPAQEAARWRQRQQHFNLPHTTPQQLFAAAPMVQVQQRSAAPYSSSWATFGEQAPEAAGAGGAAASFGSPVARPESAARQPIMLEPSVGPLGSGAMSSVVRQYSSKGAATYPPLSPFEPARQAALPPPQVQQAPAEPQPPPQQSQAQQLQAVQPPQLLMVQQSLLRQLTPQPAPQSVLLEGLSSGWATFGDAVPASCQASRPTLPEVCRDSIHSPLAMGFAAVHRHSSSVSGSMGTPGRGSTSSGGEAPASGGLQARLSVTKDAFAEVTQLAAAEASQHLHHRSSSGGVGAGTGAGAAQHQAAPRTSSTSSWAEFACAQPAADPTNPFLQLPPQQQQALARQLTPGTRTKSWGDWGATWPPQPASQAGTPPSAELSSLRL